MDSYFFNVPDPEYEDLPFPEHTVSSKDRNFSLLRRHLFYLWTYLVYQDMWEEVVDFIEDHRDVPTPFDLFPF